MPPTRRSRCPLACALDLVGDRWSLIILRDLMFDEHRHFLALHAHNGFAGARRRAPPLDRPVLRSLDDRKPHQPVESGPLAKPSRSIA